MAPEKMALLVKWGKNGTGRKAGENRAGERIGKVSYLILASDVHSGKAREAELYLSVLGGKREADSKI